MEPAYLCFTFKPVGTKHNHSKHSYSNLLMNFVKAELTVLLQDLYKNKFVVLFECFTDHAELAEHLMTHLSSGYASQGGYAATSPSKSHSLTNIYIDYHANKVNNSDYATEIISSEPWVRNEGRWQFELPYASCTFSGTQAERGEKKKDPAGACRLEVIVLKFMFTRLYSAQQVNNAEDAAVTIWEVTMMYEVV